MDNKGCSFNKNNSSKNGSIISGLGSVLFESLKKYSNRILQYIADTDETDTYGQVLTRCIRTALKLKEKGLTKDDVISSCSHNHKNSIIPYIASAFLGIKTANFDPNLSHLDTVHLLKLLKPKIIFVSLESLPFMEKCLKESQLNIEMVVFGESKKYSNFSEYLEPNTNEDKFQPVVIDNIKETIMILCSSGTTGLPKGICLSHYGLFSQCLYTDKAFWCNDGESVALVYATLYWISAVMMLTKCIVDGNSRVVCAQFHAPTTWRLIEKYKITSIFLAPYHARDFLAFRQKDVETSSLKFFLTASAPVTVKLMEDLREAVPSATVVQGYGQTEASGFICIFDAHDPEQKKLQIRKPLSCGKILPEYKWKIVDPTTEEVLGPNQRGELRYKIDYQMNGYYKMDSSSAYDSEGFIKSGDIVYYDEENCFFIVDRIKEMFKYKGWHIIPALLEDVLMNHPAVKEAVVIGIPHELDGDYPMGLVVLNKRYNDVTPEDIERYIEQKVPDAQRLRAGVKFVNELVRTTTGKVRRSAMKKMVLTGEIVN